MTLTIYPINMDETISANLMENKITLYVKKSRTLIHLKKN